jgi:hypothetical protein
MPFTQLHKRSYSVLRAARGEQPVFEFDLLDHEQIVGVHHYWEADYESRATVDHHIVVWVAVSL